jgi:isopenicillin N synthase-like dioxygenase
VSRALQLDFSLNEYREDYEDNLCLHHYPVTQRVERNPAHKDFGILTLLVQEDAAGSTGLEVADLTSTNERTSEDVNKCARFVPVYPEADEITVLAGVSLQKLAGKAAIAPSVHRVMAALSTHNEHGVGLPRYSIAYFVHPDGKSTLGNRGETAGGYLRRRREMSHIPS